MALAAETLLAVVTSLLFLGRKGIWLDEGYSFVAAHRSWSDLGRLIIHDEANMSPYYLLMHAWLSVGRSEGVLRLLSVVPAVVAVPLIAQLGRRLVDRRTGLVAGLLAALNLMVVQYAQEMRAYSMALLLSVVSALLFLELLERPRRRTALAWALVCGLGVYVHFFVALAVVAQLASLLLLRREDRPRMLWGAVTCIAVLDAPLAWFLLHRTTGPLGLAHGASLADAGRLLYRLSGSIPLALLALLLLAMAARSTWARVRGQVRGREVHREAFGWVALGLPPALALAVSVAHPSWNERYFIICLPFFLVLLAAALTSLRPDRLRLPALAMVLVLSVVALGGWYAERLKQGTDWRGATLLAQRGTEPGDGYWFLPGTAAVPFGYYTWRRDVATPYDVGFATDGLRGRLHPLQVPRTQLLQRIARIRRLWVVMLAPTTATAAHAERARDRLISSVLGTRFRMALSRRFGPILVVRRYDRVS